MKPLQIRSAGIIVSMVFLMQAFWLNQAQAHKVVLFGWVEAGNINIEAGFGGKRTAKNCVIKAFDTDHTLIYEGKTDDKGRHVFKIPPSFSSDMLLELEAGTGHKGSWTIQADEFTAVSNADSVQESKKVSPVGKGIDPLKIIAGLSVIFGLALVVKLMKARLKGGKDD